MFYIFPIVKKYFEFLLPNELKSLSSETKNLLLGYFDPIQQEITEKINKIVVYISLPDNKGK